MKLVTFYSFKGGSGRTVSALNIIPFLGKSGTSLISFERSIFTSIVSLFPLFALLNLALQDILGASFQWEHIRL